MTVQVTDRLSQLYVGNGVNTRFDFTFRIFDQEDETGVAVRIKVGNEFEFLDETKYTVTINPDNLGGYVNFLDAPDAQTYFYIAGKTPVDQLLDITNYDNFYPDAIERALDKLTAILQEWKHLVDFETQARILADLNYDELAQQREAELRAYIDGIASAITGQPVLGLPSKFVVDGDETQEQINDKSARAFASIEDLLNYTPRGNGQIAFVKSYYADQNTGGRYFKYDSEKANENDGVVVFNGWVGGITNNTITSEMVGIRDGEDAASKFDLLAAFMQNKSYNLRLSGSIFSTKELVLMYLKDSIIEADDLYHVPPLNKPLNNNRGAITIRNSTNVTVQDSYLHGECVAHYDNREDGQAGIVFIDSVGCKALENRIERFHAWAVLGTNCTDTLVTGNTIKHIVRQSGINIWFGSGSNNIARNNTISDVGLYGVEFENHTLLNSDGVAKDNIISDCFQGATLVNLIENAKVVGNEISQCYRGITYSLSTSSAKLRLFRNTVSNCQMGLQHGVAEMRSSRNTYTYEAQSFYKTSPYSSVSAIDADGYVYVAESAGITNGLTWSVGEVVQINGTSYTVSTVATGVSLPNYAYTFVKLKFSVNPTGLRVGDFILHAPNALDNIGMHLYLGGNFNSRLDSIKGYPIPVRESMSTSGGTRQLNSLQVDSNYFVFKFDNVLSNTNCKFTVENLQLTGNANVALVDPTDTNSKTTCSYLSSIGYIRPKGYYTLDFLDAVSYGNFAAITQGRRTLKPMQVIAVELEYTNLASNTGNPALLCNDQNLEITLGKVLSGTGVSGIGFTGISPFPINAYLNTFKLITTGSLSDLGYNRLRYKLFYI
ncbi:right-handed parallel beta-helix repeat-containing protein [Acinetobacter pittii]|uniref:right-handed parallel beta-helix repeat-containing protein n=1 Tax=Acinetobacter pittii TaxID=48296 RepID=UPI001950A3DB|nr:right-handed parallel beta-helix repeat-containing protein [Acinetobacter pittii]QRO96122.1 right-handed parallel beta-helix repeat-containing protein [Acinetobacter pittii]